MLNANSLVVFFLFLEEKQRTKRLKEPFLGASQTNFRGDFVVNAKSLVVLVAFTFWRRNKGPASSEGQSREALRRIFVLISC